jgi:hypothetical protein
MSCWSEKVVEVIAALLVCLSYKSRAERSVSELLYIKADDGSATENSCFDAPKRA